MNRADCPYCGVSVALSASGIFRPHGWEKDTKAPCEGSSTRHTPPPRGPSRCVCGALRIEHRNGGPIQGRCSGFRARDTRPGWMREPA